MAKKNPSPPPQRGGPKSKGGSGGKGPRPTPKRGTTAFTTTGGGANKQAVLGTFMGAPFTTSKPGQDLLREFRASDKAATSPVGKATNSKAARSAAVKKAWLKRRHGGK